MFIYFEYNVGVIENVKGEMKGGGIMGPFAEECVELWTRISSKASSIV